MFHKPKHILIILVSKFEKFLAFCYRVGKCIQQEDSNIFKVRQATTSDPANWPIAQHELPIKMGQKVLFVADIKCY